MANYNKMSNRNLNNFTKWIKKRQFVKIFIDNTDEINLYFVNLRPI